MCVYERARMRVCLRLTSTPLDVPVRFAQYQVRKERINNTLETEQQWSIISTAIARTYDLCTRWCHSVASYVWLRN